MTKAFSYLPSDDRNIIKTTCHRWMNLCTKNFDTKIHMILRNVTLCSEAAPVTVFSKSKKKINSLTLSNVDMDFECNHSVQVLQFLKKLQTTVVTLKLQYTIRPCMDLITGFRNVVRLELDNPSWYLAISESRINFLSVRQLRLEEFSIDIFGKNVFASFFKKIMQVQEIEIEGEVVENYGFFGTYFGSKLKQIHVRSKDRTLMEKNVNFLTVLKGLELRSLTFVIEKPTDIEFLLKLTAAHPTLETINVITTTGGLPIPDPKIMTMKVELTQETLVTFMEMQHFKGLQNIEVKFPCTSKYYQVNCFFGHVPLDPQPEIKSVKMSGSNKNCICCFYEMTNTYRNLTVFHYEAFFSINFEIVQVLGEQLPYLEELVLKYKDYTNCTEQGFATYFTDWPCMMALKRITLEPLSWKWTQSSVTNFCKACPALEFVHLDGGTDIDDTFMAPFFKLLHDLQYFTIQDTRSRSVDTPSFRCLFPNDLTPDPALEGNPYPGVFEQPCPKLTELRLLSATIDNALKLRLFKTYQMLKVIQDRKTLMTSRDFLDQQDKRRTEMMSPSRVGSRKFKYRLWRDLKGCFC